MNLVRKSYLNFVIFILMNVQIKIQHTPKEIQSVYFLMDLCNLEQQLRMETMEHYTRYSTYTMKRFILKENFQEYLRYSGI